MAVLGMSKKAERTQWIRMASGAGITIERGESLESIKKKVTKHDRERFNVAAAGPDNCTCWATSCNRCPVHGDTVS
jgi:hypothetical protein